MSMSTHVVGFRPADDKWEKMRAVYDACQAAGTQLPASVAQFFGFEPPDERGVEVNIEKTDAVSEWQEDMREGIEVDITKLPENVTVIRFYNAY
ncbi:MAG: hypothetical protein WCV82_04460 [Candidatus Paceibacterota bacterium]